LLRRTRHEGWAAEDFVGIAVLALALTAYAAALAVHGNGFRRGVLRRSCVRGDSGAPGSGRTRVPRTGQRVGVPAGSNRQDLWMKIF
jgi:hypothetical protein